MMKSQKRLLSRLPTNPLRRLASIATATLMAFITVSPGHAAQSGDWTYTDNGATITITGYTGPGGELTIPESINDKPVVAIGDSAFSEQSTIYWITIPASVTSIANRAFVGCRALAVINVDVSNPNYSSVGGILFNHDQSGLIAFPADVQLWTYSIPGSVTTVGNYAFSECGGLSNVVIPASVANIGNNAFFRCRDLIRAEFAGNAPVMGTQVFDGVEDGFKVVYKSTATGFSSPTWNGYASEFETDSSEFTYWNVGGNITITRYQGSGEVVVIPQAIDGNPVVAIGDSAFVSQSTIVSIRIPAGVTSIGDFAFSDCAALTGIEVVATNTAFSSVGGVLFNQAQTTLIAFPGGFTGAYTIPGTVTSIGQNAFDGCTGLTSIAIPSSVTSIGSRAFQLCNSLTSVVIPNRVTSIGFGAFSACNRLTNVVIPNSVTSIGGEAFAGCYRLTSVTIPNSVTNIGSEAFWACYDLASAHFLGNAPMMGGGVFDDVADGFKIFYKSTATGFSQPTWNGYPSEGTLSNTAPVLRSIGNKSIAVGSTLNFTVQADDADHDVLQYSATAAP
jgi:hypothetical protein